MLDLTPLGSSSESDEPKIRKENDSILLVSDRYKSPSTSLLLFHFEPQEYASPHQRLRRCKINQFFIENKVIYVFDDFFSENESREFRDYSRSTPFSRSSFASPESRERGEEPARSMNNREKWEFFTRPPQPVKEFYKLLGMLAHRLEADISTLPWDLCDRNVCASAVATNRLERSSVENMEKGKHEDFNTDKGLPFKIPILYSKEKAYYPCNFINGDENNPWLISFMLYATEDNFLSSEYGLGTVFCGNDNEIVLRSECRHMRFVLFEGEIVHSIESSTIPEDVKTWRVSYVFKLLINPRKEHASMKKLFYEQLKSYGISTL